MFSVTSTITRAHYNKIQAIAAKIYHDRKRVPNWKIKVESLLFAHLPSICIIAPLILAFFSPNSIRPWHLLYFVVTSMLWGFYACHRHFRLHIYPLLNIFIRDLEKPQETIYRLTESRVEIATGNSVTTRPWDEYSDVRLTDDFVLLERVDLMEFVPVESFAHLDDAIAFSKFASMHVQEKFDKAQTIEPTEPQDPEI